MDACRLTDADLDRYHTNLTALAEQQPLLAQRVETMQIPATVVRATGRDGSETFRTRREDGSWQWLGRSSMPTMSAPAFVEGLQTQGRNLIIPTIATGREALLAEQRMPRHCAVFVYEQDVVALKLVLHLHDFSSLIQHRRLVLLSGDDAGAALLEFFSESAGYEFPHHLLPLAVLGSAQQDRIRLDIESAGPRVVRAQWEEVGRMAQRMRGRGGFALTENPRVAILSRDPRPETIALTNRLGFTARQVGWAAEASVPDRPDRCHTVARLEVICRHKPDLIVLLNCLKGPLAEYLTDGQPVCSWLTTLDSVDAVAGEGLAGNRTIFATRPEILDRLRAAGASPDAVHLLEVAADAALFAPTGQSPAGQPDAACEVAVLADAIDLRPQTANITLASHVRLWNELCNAVGRSIGTWREEGVPRVLERAERVTGTKLTDPHLRDRFADLIRSRLVPTMLARSAIERMVRAGLDVAVWGRGWESSDGVKTLVRGPIPDAIGRSMIYDAAGVVICPYFEHRAAQTVLDCSSAGGCPLLRTPQTPLAQMHPQLAEVLQAVPQASSVDDLAREAQRLVADAEARRAVSEGARAAVLERHTLAHRLRSMRDALRQG
ncbi:MAG: glycosyltransferase family protein [Planctomycetota bacterium]|jgi:hypothetical protein